MSWFDPPDILRDLDGLDASLRFSEVLLSRQKRDTAEQWIVVGAQGAPGFAPGWTYSAPGPRYGAQNPPGYFKTSDGWVFLRGNVTATSNAPTTIFGLPGGYRPENDNYYPVTYTATVTGMLRISSAGAVELLSPGVSAFTSGGLSFDGMRFRAYVP